MLSVAATEVVLIPANKIHIPEDYLRLVDDAAAQTLARLIASEGQKTPIAVYKSTAREGGSKPYTLIYGARRLRAVQILGRDEVEAVLRPKDETNMMAIADNLAMPFLDALEQGEHLIAWRTAWETQHGSVTRGGDRKSNGQRDRLIENLRNQKNINFYKELAEKFEISERTARRRFKIGALHPDLRNALRGTANAREYGKLARLTKLSLTQQGAVAVALSRNPDLDC
jgi:ParB family chromosome partitioning protein